MSFKARVIIHTDGSCWNTNKKVAGAKEGGIGAVISINDGVSLRWIEISEGVFVNTTSARMEVRALLRALELSPINSYIKIYTDATYVRDTVKSHYFEHPRDYTYKIANMDIWRHVRDWYLYHIENGSSIIVKWVKGHAGNVFNEKADQLATKARKNGEHRILCRKVNTN